MICIRKGSSFCIFLYLLLSAQTSYAFEKLSFDVAQIVTNNWKIKEAKISLFDLDENNQQQLSLSIKQLALPEPFSEIQFININCLSFTWQQNKILCQKGRAKLKSDVVDFSPFKFSFSITEKSSRLILQDIPLAKGKLSLTVKEESGHWSVSIKAGNIKLKSLASYIKHYQLSIDEINNGSINADAKLTGTHNGLNTLLLKAMFNKISFQAEQGNIAAESLDFAFDLFATKNKDEWKWEHSIHLITGEVYKSPVYIEIKEEENVHIQTVGVWPEKGYIAIEQANVLSPGIVDIEAREVIIKEKPVYGIESAKIQVNIKDLDYFSTHYISPFVEQTVLEGIKLKGQVVSKVDLSDSVINQVSSKFTNFTIEDLKQRIGLINGKGEFNWSNNTGFILPSTLQWDQLKIRAIPFEKGQLNFFLRHKNIKLLNNSSIKVLGGVFTINRFNWQQNIDNEPTVYFEGGINNVSLEQLSQVLDWTPMTGNISGKIPGVEYENKVLKMNGELKVDVFDGVININKLASSGLFTDFPKIYMDMEINNLDLHTVTQKFKMGVIEGHVSGFINNLYLENWEPVTFYGWLGTPENDDSRHRISQKAVENIASIGGGGAADVISKGFLSFFDNFGYDRLGFGCYLHQGVCQLMGVEAAEQGYYIVKGGGLPRIDVIGYNPQVDWKVLMQRLSRISDTETVVIE